MPQSIFLRAFIDDIVRTRGAARAGEIEPPTREALEREFAAVAHDAAVGLLGDATPIEVTLSDELGEVEFAQRLIAREAPTDHAREVPLLALRRLGGEFERAQDGDEFRVPITYTLGRRDLDEANAKRFGALLPLPLHTGALWHRLNDAMSPALERYYPRPTYQPGTLGALLAEGGGWTRGVRARSGELELEIEGAFVECTRVQPLRAWVDYGLLVVLRRGDEVLWRSTPEPGYARLGDGASAPTLENLQQGANESAVAVWASLPTDASARPAFEAALRAVVDGVAAGGSLREQSALRSLLSAAVRAPRANGAWDWMERELPRLLLGHESEREHEGRHLRFRVIDVYTPERSIEGFGQAAIRVRVTTDDPHVTPSLEGEPIELGRVDGASLDLEGPRTDEERQDLERIVATFRAWLDAHTEHHVAARGTEGLESFNYFYAFDGYFPLVQLLAQRLAWGRCSPAPVPAFDDAVLERAARTLKPVKGARRAELLASLGGPRARPPRDPLAAFAAQGWHILIDDDTTGAPWGSDCGLRLVPPEGGDAVYVMMVDAWNPQTRLVVDGDAFAFRRFLEWLRGGVLRSGYDQLLVFECLDPLGDESGDEPESNETGEAPRPGDASDSADEADEDAEGDTARAMSLSDWLLFGMPECGDRFLVDWRAQWHVVNAATRVADFAGIFGFAPAFIERLRDRDVPLWRRFLREVVDPRFAY